MARVAGLFAAVLLAASAAAADASWSPSMFRDLMSPYCPGRALDACPSQQAAELRAWIAAQEAAGRPRDEVEAQLVRIYGESVLSAPPAQGWGLTAYVIPVAAMAGGAALLALFLRGVGRRAAAEDTPRPAAVDPELARRVDEEIDAA